MADQEPKRSWTDIVDEPMRGEIPPNLSLTIQEARQIIRAITPQAFGRLEALNKHTAGLLVVLTAVAGMDDLGQVIVSDPPSPPHPDDTDMMQLYEDALRSHEATLKGVNDVMAKGQMYLASVPAYMNFAKEDIGAIPDEAARREAERDLTSLHNAITDVVCKEKGPVRPSGWSK